jgi:uncharacterized NAD-dependent epimerase/dehydratase family protein
MHALPAYRRILLLTEGHLGVFTSKTAASLLRYRAPEIVGVIDSVAAGRAIAEFIPWSSPVPILPHLDAATALAPDALFIGIAPVGGTLPPAMHTHVRAALDRGLDVVSGLHVFLADDHEFAALAARHGARIFDLRRPPASRCIAEARARTTRCRRILTVGTDCNVGKMVTALELTAAARARGRDARFLATGQTGMMIAGGGVAIDAVVSDFASGAVEQLVLDAAGSEICFVEGQGSIAHPGFSPVTLALLHGACPDALILVHQVGTTRYKARPHHPLPALGQLRDIYERSAGLLHPARIVAVALNSHGQDAAALEAEKQRIQNELGLPAADPIREGCAELLAALV